MRLKNGRYSQHYEYATYALRAVEGFTGSQRLGKCPPGDIPTIREMSTWGSVHPCSLNGETVPPSIHYGCMHSYSGCMRRSARLLLHRFMRWLPADGRSRPTQLAVQWATPGTDPADRRNDDP